MKKLFTFFVLMLLVVSCTKEAEVSPNGNTSGEVVSFTASVVDATQTRATLINSWSGGEQVALFVDEVLYPYTIAADGSMSGDDIIVHRDEEHTYTAFYPYDESISTIEEYEAACTAGYVDYMSATVTTLDMAVELQFSHQMAALSFTLLVNATATPTILLALAGDINSTVDLEVELTKTSATISQWSVNYFVAEGTDLTSAFIKLEFDGSVHYYSIDQGSSSTLDAGKQYAFSCFVGLNAGSGTEDDPYIVYTSANMRKVGTGTDGWSMSSHYKLAWDIDLESIEFTAIGASSQNFTGSFDGDGHEISGLYINQPDTYYQGLFGCVNGATIKNLSVSGSVTGNYYTGGIVGYANLSASVFENCHNKCSVSATGIVGGIVGRAYDNTSFDDCHNAGTIKGSDSYVGYVGGVVGEVAYGITMNNCYNTGAIEGLANYVGGVVGLIYDATMNNCYNTGTVKGLGERVGGVVGYVNISATMNNCYNTGTIEGSNDYVGGVVAYASSTTMNNCYNIGTVKCEDYLGNWGYFGGVVGYITNSSKANNCYNTGTVKSLGGNVGGVAGYATTTTTTVEGCYNTGSVEGASDSVGGVVGQISSSSTVENCYNTGSVKSSYAYASVGGVVGNVYSTSSSRICYLKSSYNVGLVQGGAKLGGVAGYASSISEISYCYYDKDVVGDIGAVNGADDTDGIAYCSLTTAMMKGSDETEGTLLYYFNTGGSTSWTADTENINNGYPILTWQTSNN